MGFFSRIRRMLAGQTPVPGGIPILAPVDGTLVALDDVPDQVFSEKIVGDGIAIMPTGKLICAPIAGTIGKIFDSNHAFSIESPHGIELFVHVGIGTVELRGVGFERLQQEGAYVEAGTPILAVDLDLITGKVDSLLTPVVVANMEDIKQIQCASGQVIAGETTIFQVVN
ncbi:PTS glucose transporter subunit IIA [Shewanella sp. NIFS-20-20]|uniref:PTS glucose transporter subunit IIA n=1 Tax=Shewanella sp. NIFS-20-20 TaxID=2853806 RepID=UPI001C45B22C|nr:PTS glucose transporter subunit IIA [Shewanella sp. NIFS-20-20]MBV7317035.1 PTS glucose transporter subunit IIA [Shewanella sp. NIFS-20-20]